MPILAQSAVIIRFCIDGSELNTSFSSGCFVQLLGVATNSSDCDVNIQIGLDQYFTNSTTMSATLNETFDPNIALIPVTNWNTPLFFSVTPLNYDCALAFGGIRVGIPLESPPFVLPPSQIDASSADWQVIPSSGGGNAQSYQTSTDGASLTATFNGTELAVYGSIINSFFHIVGVFEFKR